MKPVIAMLCASCIPISAQNLIFGQRSAMQSQVVTYYQLSYHPKRHVRKLVIEATKKLRKKDLDDARPLLQSALAADQECWDAHIDLGVVYFWEGDNGSARTEFETATALDPFNALGYANLAVCDMKAGRPGSAIQLAKKALQLDPLNDLAHRVLKAEGPHGR